MLISSVTLGLVSDKFGRLACTKIGFLLSMGANGVAILTNNYIILNVCIFSMAFAQVAVGNALCTMIMEATSPKYRAVAMFEYMFGWGLGVIFIPIVNNLTKDYRLFLAVLLGAQLALLPWLYFGIFESIRWLLSEGKINRAQIELSRACRINGVQTSARLAQDIAKVQVQQVRRASRMLEAQMAPTRLAQALESEVADTARELDMLSAAIKRTFGFDGRAEDHQQRGHNQSAPATLGQANGARKLSSLDRRAALAAPDNGAPIPPASLLALSPTLARKSFCLEVEGPNKLQVQEEQQPVEALDQQQRPSITTQALIQLALKYSKQVERQEEGSFYLIRMFHRNVWRQTLLLILFFLTMETSYYGLVQANKFVGKSVDLNYIIGGVADWIAATASVLLLIIMSRKGALILPTVAASLACLGMALSYQLIPDPPMTDTNKVTTTTTLELVASTDLVDLRHKINMYLMNIARFSFAVGMQIAGTISMESYPSNLRQTAPGAIMFVGRVGSIMAPFLFSDHSQNNWLLKTTLVGVATLGMFCCALTPLIIRDNKDKDLQDHMNEIE